ncbi:MAG: cupin domain-containing protein [Burkholderiaceae bacterium]|nr:MAG: cupin domain-containing protein [Burkholderiaceae bacterium]TAM04757.1 MAG: cupin domain-containing protein [Pusillimonas sp.]
MSSPAVTRLVHQFDLQPHPEGGYYRETYRCEERVQRLQSGQERSASTAIYYLLSGDAYSAWHRIRSDELWHFHAGCPLDIHVLDDLGQLRTLRLGNVLEDPSARFQAVVPAGRWFAAERIDHRSYSFVGCTVAPGFEFSEFELADAAQLQMQYPQHAALIQRLGRSTD